MIIQSKVNKRLFTYDSSPIQDGISYEGDKIVSKTTENIAPVLKRNYYMREGLIDQPKSSAGHLIGSIPETVYAGLIKERPEFLTDDKALKEFLNSNEGAWYKTTKGGI